VVRDRVRSYYAQIRALLRERPDLRPCLKRCRHCRIFFFTHPRNASRADLRCGFGCREAHRRRDSHRRSAAFYCENPDEKRRQNRKRYLHTARMCRKADVHPRGEPPAPIVEHVRMVVSLIERRRVELCEIVEMLAKKGRQHRMVWRQQRAYGRRRVEGRGS
jgi:hypothetical protein